MLAALKPWGCERSDLKRVGHAALGRNLLTLLPEDEFDSQPLLLAGGKVLLTVDARIDNRAEIASAIGLADASGLSDAVLLGAAWTRWSLDLFDHVLGDIALAVWDTDREELTLARSAMALKPLFYHSNANFLTFASMPAGLHAVIPKALNFEHAASVAGLYSYLGSSTIFEGVQAVRHGHAMRFRRGVEEQVELWRPTRNLIRYQHESDYADHLRQETERAVRAQLRRHDGKIASQLSGGRDSSAVTATAAHVLAESGEELTAITAAPREGFAGPTLEGRPSDESSLAAKTAALHGNVDHIICRTRALPLAERLSGLHAFHHSPLLNPVNLLWWEEMNRVAAEERVTVLLNGSSGNFGLSAGGVDQLPDLLAEEGLSTWLATAVRWSGANPVKWRHALNVILGPRLRPGVYRGLLRATGRSAALDFSVPVLRQPYRQLVQAQLADAYGDPRPPRSIFDHRAAMLVKRDNPEIMNLGFWRIDYRDPTADRRLIDFCLSLPSRQLFSARSARPAYEGAFRDLLPSDVISNPVRGYQSADWFEFYRKQEVGEALRNHGKNSLVAELLDLDYLNRLIQAWPDRGFGQRSVIYTYANTVVGALALANFIDTHFPS